MKLELTAIINSADIHSIRPSPDTQHTHITLTNGYVVQVKETQSRIHRMLGLKSTETRPNDRQNQPNPQ